MSPASSCDAPQPTNNFANFQSAVPDNQRRARLCAMSIGIIAIFVITSVGGINFIKFIALLPINPIVSMAEFGGPHFVKSVVVLDRPPHIQICRSFTVSTDSYFHSEKLIQCLNFNAYARPARHNSTRSNHNISFARVQWKKIVSFFPTMAKSYVYKPT